MVTSGLAFLTRIGWQPIPLWTSYRRKSRRRSVDGRLGRSIHPPRRVVQHLCSSWLFFNLSSCFSAEKRHECWNDSRNTGIFVVTNFRCISEAGIQGCMSESLGCHMQHIGRLSSASAERDCRSQLACPHVVGDPPFYLSVRWMAELGELSTEGLPRRMVALASAQSNHGRS